MTISSQAILDRLISKIQTAHIDPQPSDNIYMEDLFEPSLYRDILSHLPPKEAYDPINHPDAHSSDGASTRGILDLTSDTLNRFPSTSRDFWQMMETIFTSDALQKAIIQKFQVKIQERFGSEIPEMTSVPVFYKDYPGYFIRVHPDTDWKVATFQFYLPADESQIHLGTSFHSKEGDQFPLLKTNAFKPNSGYAFARTDDSWHSVQKLGPHERERNTLALTVYLKGKIYKSDARYV